MVVTPTDFPPVSVVIPTRRRPHLIRRCLVALTAQDYPSDRLEIVVVEDGGPAGAEQVVKELRRNGSPIRLRSTFVPPGGPAAARNAGWRLAEGEIIAFTDDDTIPDPRWVSEAVKTFALGADAVSGRTIVPTPARPTDYQRNVKGLERATFATCNAFCRREVLQRVGGFDDRFTRAYREDSDLEFSLLEAGAHIVRSDAAVVVHPAPEGEPFVSLRLQRNQFFDALLYKKHPRLFRERIRQHPPWRYYAINASLLVMVMGIAARRGLLARLAGIVWLRLVGSFFARRQHGNRMTLGHLADMAITSVLIPPVAVYWRLRGAWVFRTPLL